MKQVLGKVSRHARMLIDPAAAAAFVVGAFGSSYAQERSRLDEVLQRGSQLS